MDRNWGTLNSDNIIQYADDVAHVNGRDYISPSDNIRVLEGKYRIISQQPVEDGYYFVSTETGELKDGKIYRIYDKKKIEPSFDDYDSAMEQHITQTRIDRGYTTREPSAYMNSSVPQFAQDAKDWQDFLDATMIYGKRCVMITLQLGLYPV